MRTTEERNNRGKHSYKIFIIIAVVLLALGFFLFYMFNTPHITLNGDSEMEVTMAEGFIDPGASARFSTKDISNRVRTDSEVNDKKVGTYTVTYKVAFLGKEDTATRTVTVVDKEPPELTLNGSDTVTIRPGQGFDDPGATAVDDSDGDITDKVRTTGLVDYYHKGEYKITYSATDSYGNETHKSRTIVVKGEPVITEKGVIYLTFDDGPSSTVTPKILNTLEKNNVPATFFIINYGKDQIPTLKRMLKDGCTIGIHGYSHDYGKIYKSTDAFMDNVKKLDKKLQEDLNYKAFVIRFPGGSSNTVSRDACKGIMTKLVKKVPQEGYLYNDWNVDSTDASGNGVAAERLVESVKTYCKPDRYNVILMHDTYGKETTAKALPQIIQWGKANGYTFKAMKPDSPTIHHGVNN